MRFCMITTFYPPYSFGGDGVFTRQLSNELARRGHTVDVIHCQDAYRLCARRDPPPADPEHPNVTVHGLRSRWGPLSPLATQQTGRPYFKSARLREILERGFDVIHYHNISLVGGPDILRYGQGVKLYTLHEYWLVCPTHVLFRYQRAPCRRPHCLTCSLAHRRPPAWWRYTNLLSRCLKHVDVFLAPARFSVEMHRARGLDLPAVHLPNFVPEGGNASPPSTPRPPAGPTGEPYVLFVGRLERLKGAHTLIPLFRHYPRARLVIAGAGREEKALRRLAGNSRRIEFAGYLSDEPLRELVRRAVAVVVPSLCYEIQPLVVLEAFRQQTPVVLRRIGGLTELIEESGGGLLYQTDDELMTAIDRLTGQPELRRELGEKGYAAYLEKWTAEAYLQRYFEVIHDVQAGRSMTPPDPAGRRDKPHEPI